MESSVKKVLNMLKVNEKNMPDFKYDYMYYTKVKEDNSKIYMIFFYNTKRLYVIEDMF